MNPRKRYIISSHGFSLVEVLVAVGLLSILALAFSALLTSTMDGQRNIENRFEVLVARQQVYDTLSSAVACSNSIGGLNPTAAVSGVQQDLGVPIKNSFGTSVINVGQLYSNQRLNLSKIAFTDFNANTAALGDETVSLQMTFIPVNGSGPDYVRTIPLFLTLDAGGLITSCKAGGPVIPLFSGCIEVIDSWRSSFPGNSTSTITCPATHPNALRGGCESNCAPMIQNYLDPVTGIQRCDAITNTGALCTGPGQKDIRARIICCPP